MKRLIIGGALTLASLAGGAEAGNFIGGNTPEAHQSHLDEEVGALGGVVLAETILFLALSSPKQQERRHDRLYGTPAARALNWRGDLG